MRNILIAGAVVAAGAAGYYFSQQEDGPLAPAKSSPLAYVPADTVIFSGQLAPFPLKNYLSSTAFSQAALPDEFYKELESGSDDPAEKFLASLAKSYFQAASSPAQFQSEFGLPDELRMLIYTVGFLPVARYEVTSEAALWKVLDKAEQESGLKHEARTLGEQTFRAYVLDDSPSGKGDRFELLVAYVDGWAVWTANTHLNDEQAVKVALGVEKPAAALADSGKLEAIEKKHGFSKDMLTYVDHQGLVKGFTTADGNSLAKMITQAMQAENDPDALADIRTPECQAEMGAIAANWPQTVFGMHDMQITAERSYMKGGMVIESNNKVVMDALSAMQGYIPAYLNKAQVLGMGVGLDVNTLGTSLTSIWNNMLEPTYKCEPLIEMQESVREANPAALAMFTGMAQGVKGISAGISDFSLDMDSPQPTLNTLDAVMTLTADNPAVLFNMAKSFAPPLAAIQLPTDGSSLDLSTVLPIPPEVNVKPMLALKGKHLVIYSGKGEEVANGLATEEPTGNGLYNISIDYKKMLTPVMPMIQMAGDPEVAEQLSMLTKMDMNIKMDMKLNAQGIEMISEVDVRAPKAEVTAK